MMNRPQLGGIQQAMMAPPPPEEGQMPPELMALLQQMPPEQRAAFMASQGGGRPQPKPPMQMADTSALEWLKKKMGMGGKDGMVRGQKQMSEYDRSVVPASAPVASEPSLGRAGEAEIQQRAQWIMQNEGITDPKKAYEKAARELGG